jgi:hypothetical protein
MALWIASWLESRVPSVIERGIKYDDSQYSYLYVVVQNIAPQGNRCDPDNWKVRVFAQGGSPHAPEEWPERPLFELVSFAISDLRGREPSELIQ